MYGYRNKTLIFLILGIGWYHRILSVLSKSSGSLVMTANILSIPWCPTSCWNWVSIVKAAFRMIVSADSVFFRFSSPFLWGCTCLTEVPALTSCHFFILKCFTLARYWLAHFRIPTLHSPFRMICGTPHTFSFLITTWMLSVSGIPICQLRSSRPTPYWMLFLAHTPRTSAQYPGLLLFPE